MTSITTDTITNGQVSSQTNCTTNIKTEISAVILQPTIAGNNCSSVIAISSPQIVTNELTYVPTANPTVSLCFGYLYNWYAATDVRNISAAGWEVPTMSDYQILADYLGAAGNYASNTIGGKLKVTGLTYWITPNAGATNEVGFNGIGSAGRIGAGFTGLGTNGNLWVRNNASATNGNLALLYSSIQNFQCTTSASYPKFNGYALRLKKITTSLVNGQTGTYVGNDGKIYDTICIGTQEWMSENLTETKYRNLFPIQNVPVQSTWNGLTTGAYCIYNNDPLNVSGCPTLPPPINPSNLIKTVESVEGGTNPRVTFGDLPFDYIKCVYNNRLALGYFITTNPRYWCNGEIMVGSQLFDFNNPTSPISNTSNYVIDLTSDATSLTINYNLTPPNSKFIIRLVNGIVTSITNFNDIDNCPFPCTSCLP
jgi:uncharacterized protein (TIGR02145 family)